MEVIKSCSLGMLHFWIAEPTPLSFWYACAVSMWRIPISNAAKHAFYVTSFPSIWYTLNPYWGILYPEFNFKYGWFVFPFDVYILLELQSIFFFFIIY